MFKFKHLELLGHPLVAILIPRDAHAQVSGQNHTLPSIIYCDYHKKYNTECHMPTRN